MGRVMGIEPTCIGTTNRGLNHLATPAIFGTFEYTTKKSILQYNCNFLSQDGFTFTKQKKAIYINSLPLSSKQHTYFFTGGPSKFT